ncbi:Kunitz-type trypsin inhibitor [Heracleum sosnowskyi]|uniref:Kunitz-type trypsin inhibitor n=1 Tax=Heracleum sosnowskyi TaxID=360622 RepID=A0AAD8JI70_9APIA|nr:Kunitz-type trypsin inhibitor [Heracleum sosnowskyi]
MKTLLLLFSLLVLASYSHGLDIVLDSDGLWVERTSRYYIWPILPGGPSGPLTLKATNHTHQCLFNVVQEGNKDDVGLPFGFIMANRRTALPVIFEEEDVNIMYTGNTFCNESAVWKVEGKYGEERFVKSGGVEGNPGPETVRNWFKIVRYMDAYKLVHCPSVCLKCGSICRDLAIVYEDNALRLGLTTGMPVQVVFKLAT